MPLGAPLPLPRFPRLAALASLAALAQLAPASASAQRASQAADSAAARTPWDVTLARGKTRDIDFTTSEGTWMSVDLSRDGSWLVFDLLGHIYTMPADRKSVV